MTGKDKGKTGKVTEVYPKRGKVLVLGVNIYKRHQKRRDDKNPGGIMEFARPLPISNVSLVDPKTKKPTRVGVTRTNKTVTRIAKKSGETL